MTSATDSHFHVLIAEDDRELALLLQRYFNARGVRVSLAHDGESARARFTEGAPDVVLVDAMLPRTSTPALIARFRAHARTPIIVMSAALFSSRDEAELAASLKVDAAFRKPLPLRDTFAAVDHHAALFSGKPRLTTPSTGARTQSSPGTVLATPPSTSPRANTGEGTRPATMRNLPAVVHIPSLPTFATLAAELVRFFETRATAIVTIASGPVTREIAFLDGLITDVRSTAPDERETEDAFHLVERHAWDLLTKMLLEGGVIASMEPPRTEPLLRARFRMCPLKVVMAAAMKLPDDATRAALEPHALRAVHRGNPFLERATLFTQMRPESPVPSLLGDVPSVEDAMSRVRGSHEGLRELLALVLVQAVLLGGPDLVIQAAPRAAVLTPSLREWPGDPVRTAIAREWQRTNGSTPRRILGLADDDGDEAVKPAHAAHVARFGPPVLDDVELGPAKIALGLVRARRDAAMRALLRIQS